MTSAPLSLIQVLTHYLTPQQARRYLKSKIEGQGAVVRSSRHYYNTALRDLSIRDSEGAIFHIIMALDMEPKHTSTLHLARTMLFGLNKLFHEEGGELYKMKYPNLTVWKTKIEQSIREKEFEAQRLRNEIALHQPRGPVGRLLDRWFGRWRRERVQKWEERLQQIPVELKTLQKQRSHAIKLNQVQEYAKVLSLALEISLFPARYAWVNTAETPKAYQEKIWYG